MAWGSSTGTVAAANNKVAGTTYTSGAITCPTGNQIILVIGFDNTALSLPNVNSITVPSGETATWVQLGTSPANTGTSGGGARADVWGITPTQTWTAFSPVVTFSASITAKASVGVCKSGGSLNFRETPPHTGTGTSSSTPTFSNTLPLSGDYVIGWGAWQTATTPGADSDTTNGSWDTAITSATAGSTDNTNIVALLQTKTVTGTGTQAFNPTPGAIAGTGGLLALTPGGTTQQQVGRVHAEALVNATAAAQVDRVHVEVLYATGVVLTGRWSMA